MFLSELKLYSLLLIFIFLPGMALLRVFIRQVSANLYILLSLVLGLFCWTVLSVIGFILTLPLATLTTVWVCIVVISGFGIIFLLLNDRMMNIQPLKVDGIFIVLLSFTALSAIIVYWKGSYQDGDAWYHVAQAVNYLNQPRMISENAFFSGYPAGTLYDFNAWHTFIAAIALIGKFQPNFVWINLSAFFFPFSILSIYLFVKSIFANRVFAVISVITIIIFQTIQGKFPFLTSVIIPSKLCTYLLLPLFFTIEFSEDFKQRQLLLIYILFVTAFIHIYYFLVIIGYLLALHIFDLIINSRSKSDFLRILAKYTGYFLVGLPLLIALFLYCLKHYTESFPGTELHLIMLFKDWPIFSLTPDKWLFYLSVITSLFLLVNFSEWRKNRGRLFILSNILIVPLLIYNPILLKCISEFVPLNLIGRLTTPFFLLIPTLWLTWKYFPKQISLTRIQLIAFLLIIFLSGLTIVLLAPDNIKHRISFYNKYQEPMGFHDFAIHFNQAITPKSVVISDLYTSYHLPVFADIDIVSMTAHSTPPLDLKTRIRDNNRFFNPLLSPEIRNLIKQKYKIDYAVINSSILPWEQIPNADTLLRSNLYPDFNQSQNNTSVIKLTSHSELESLENPLFYPFYEKISVFPAANDIDSTWLSWRHAGMVYLNIIKPVEKLSFYSKGGTHHVFYYAVIDNNHQIIEEKVFVNEFSPHAVYQITNLSPGSWVVFSGNGISPLTIGFKE